MKSKCRIYTVEWKQGVLKELRKIGAKMASFLITEVETNLTLDPYRVGKTKALSGQWKGFRRLRVNDYRFIYQVFAEKILIQICKVGHRREIYY